MPILISTLLLLAIVLVSPAVADRMVLFMSTCRSCIVIFKRVIEKKLKSIDRNIYHLA